MNTHMHMQWLDAVHYVERAQRPDLSCPAAFTVASLHHCARSVGSLVVDGGMPMAYGMIRATAMAMVI